MDIQTAWAMTLPVSWSTTRMPGAKCAKSHERMLRERLDACRASESQPRATAQAAGRAESEALGRMKAAMQSRSNLAARIVDACIGSHRCPLTEIASDPHVIKWARQVQVIDEGDPREF